MSYVAAVDHLHGLALELAPSAARRKFDLAHMRILAAALGDPQGQFRSVLVAGTNGKGSTAATLAAICSAAGLRTALYTSPHLSRVTERIRTSEPGAPSAFVAGPDSRAAHAPARMRASEPSFEQRMPELAEIPEEEFARLYFGIDEVAQRLVATGKLPHGPSFFESLTALAFLYFAERKVEIAILEVGMGGRLDATNIVEPVLSVITDIALDHREYLGETIAEIALEKAGILRPHGTLVALPQLAEAERVIRAQARALDVRCIDGSAFLPGRARANAAPEQPSIAPLRPNHYRVALGGERLQVRSPLAGEHQQRNLALAIAAAVALREAKKPAQSNKGCYNIPNAAIEAGIANTVWPGRLEFLPPNLLLDVAHNPAGATALRSALATLPAHRPRTLLFSCLRDKDLAEMARILFPLFAATADRAQDRIVLAPIDNPRAASLDDLEHAARALHLTAHAAESPTEALALARRLTPPSGLIVATGSIYLVAALRDAILQP